MIALAAGILFVQPAVNRRGIPRSTDVCSGNVVVRRFPDRLLVDNGRVELTIDRRSGRYSLNWPGGVSVRGIGSTARLADGEQYSTVGFPAHRISKGDVASIHEPLGDGLRVFVHHKAPGKADLLQTFWVLRSRPEVFVQLTLVGNPRVASNYISPIESGSVLGLPRRPHLQSLFVPFDNDSYARYRSDGWTQPTGSYEVGAVYDDASRRAIVVGSVDHTVWKSAIRFTQTGDDSGLGLTAFAGVTGSYTHDTQPHGTVSGSRVASPRFVIGCYSDWRTGLERYGDLNARIAPPLAWAQDVPFGWSSWSGHKATLNAEDARTATDFIGETMPWFRSSGVAYVNLDSFWDNLTEDQRADFVRHTHAAGLKAGIYYTPFTAWGKLSDRVDHTSATYGDIVLKDSHGQPLPKLDGGYPIDPTNPTALARIDRELDYFVRLGFDFVKLDFLTHGALEGAHFDPRVQTGLAAYSLGMRHIVERLSVARAGRPIFIALSIAPLFPAGYGHSRRISCDVFANIGATEYLLNSSTYGWWTGGRLYRFNDGDSSCVYQPRDESPVSEAESRSRLTASIISGGIVIDGDDLTKAEARGRVLEFFSNRRVLALAGRAASFRPVEGQTGNKAGDLFEWRDPTSSSIYLAAFNFDKAKPNTKIIRPSRLGIRSLANWVANDLWTGETERIRGTLTLTLAPMDCKLLELRPGK